MSKVRELSAARFGRLLVLSRSESDSRGKAQWLCRCDCCRQVIVASTHLISGHTQSCGCLHNEAAAARATQRNMRHGMKGTSVYRAYYGAKTRCENPNSKDFKNYGGRGIKFLWSSFDVFFAEMGMQPPGFSLGRIDNSGHYAPGNCRWETPVEQQNNKRNNCVVAAFDKTLTAAEWSREIGVSQRLIRRRVHEGATPEEALSLERLRRSL